MINFDDFTKENIKEHNQNWSEIPDHPYGILIIGCSSSGKINSLFNLINLQPDIDKIYLYAKRSWWSKRYILINKPESIGLKHFNDSKGFIEYSNDMDDTYKGKILTVFNDMIADMLSNKIVIH